MFIKYEHVQKIQLEGTKKYQSIETFYLNPLQKDLFEKLVYGFSAYSKLELDHMSKSKKMRIKIDYTKAQRILNRWKQEIVNESIDLLFLRMFPKSKTVKQIVSEKGYDDNLECTISFKDLGISKKQVVNKLIEFGLLPENFFNLV